MSGDARKTGGGAGLPVRFRQRAQLAGRSGRPARGPNSPQRAPLGTVRGAAERHGVHGAEGGQPALLAVPIRPSAAHPAFTRAGNGAIRTAPFTQAVPDPNRLRWNPLPEPEAGTDFLAGLWTLGGNGDVAQRTGMAVHLYHATASMERVFSDADGELLIVPEHGGLLLRTEFGLLHAEPGHVALIPRGSASAWNCSTREPAATSARTTAPPSASPTSARSAPTAWRTCGTSWHRSPPTRTSRARWRWSPSSAATPGPRPTTTPSLDVVAWHGNHVLYVYDLRRFNVIGTISHDHPDLSIFTVLTSFRRTPPASRASTSWSRAALAGGRGHLPAAVLPPERDERVHGLRSRAPTTPRLPVQGALCRAAARCTT